jgi:hypothetical protein
MNPVALIFLKATTDPDFLAKSLFENATGDAAWGHAAYKN